MWLVLVGGCGVVVGAVFGVVLGAILASSADTTIVDAESARWLDELGIDND